MTSSHTQTGIQLSLQYFPLAFLFAACTPEVTINGVKQHLGWGEHYFDFPPGRYHVEVYFNYLSMSRCGANSIEFDLPAGSVRNVRFYMWPVIFMKGSLKVT